MANFLKTGFISVVAAAGLTVALDRPAQALSVVCTGFTGTCDASNWTIAEPGNGNVGISLTAATLLSNDSGQGDSIVSMVLNSIASLPGTVSFTYDYLTLDRDGASFDPFGYILNGSFNQIVPPPALAQFGSVQGNFSFNVNPGDTFGFYVNSTDRVLGPSFTGITNFSYTEVPGPLPVLGVAAAFGYSRKLRKRIKVSKLTATSL